MTAARAVLIITLAVFVCAACGERSRGACVTPAIDTRGWTRVEGVWYGHTFRVPPGFRLHTAAHCIEGCTWWTRGNSKVQSMSRYRSETPVDPGDPALDGYAQCYTRIAEYGAFITRWERGGRFYVDAAYRPAPRDTVAGSLISAIQASASTRATADTLLAVLHSVGPVTPSSNETR